MLKGSPQYVNEASGHRLILCRDQGHFNQPRMGKDGDGGSRAKYEVSESVRLMLETIESLDSGVSGLFLGEDGLEIPW